MVLVVDTVVGAVCRLVEQAHSGSHQESSSIQDTHSAGHQRYENEGIDRYKPTSKWSRDCEIETIPAFDPLVLISRR